MKRPSFEVIFMKLALMLAERSTCSRNQVGCVITSADYRRVLSVGYNGNATGLKNACDDPTAIGGCGCIHAEENAIISCNEPRVTPKIMFTTVSPCVACAKRIVQLGGVTQIFYYKEYRTKGAEDIFKFHNIKLTKQDRYDK